tara:strand:+ start:18562 stop:19176 length:615 start_codon:yes stop_codon:yes gene_type:complete
MKRALLLALIAAVSVAAYLYISLKTENQALQEQIASLERQNKTLASDMARAALVSRIYAASASGITGGPTKDDLERGNEVVDFVLANKPAVEQDFKSCWDRKLNTTSWGSMGPYGLTEACIDKVKDDAVAVMLFDLYKAKENARYECAKKGENRYEMAVNCWADASHRFLMGLDAVFFEIVTEGDKKTYNPLAFTASQAPEPAN